MIGTFKDSCLTVPKEINPSLLTVAAVIPAYNEGQRIGPVLRVLQDSPEVSEIIVVSDGSTDNTYEVACGFEGVDAIQLSKNRGKGGAMLEGARRAKSEVLLFFDADLVGLTPAHVADLVKPVREGEAVMAMGIFYGGRWLTDIAQKLNPIITGQRAILRAVFLQIPDLDHVGYGIELAITYYVLHRDMSISRVPLRAVTHPMKEEKLGWLRGTVSRGRMYYQMLRFRISYELHGRPPKPKHKRKKPSEHDCPDGK
jgi:glycosyltransferase involved in cell wall biosynthesis